jgi:hypothetical protein
MLRTLWFHRSNVLANRARNGETIDPELVRSVGDMLAASSIPADQNARLTWRYFQATSAPGRNVDTAEQPKKHSLGVLDLLGSATMRSRLNSAGGLLLLTILLASIHVKYVPWASGILAALCAIDAALIYYRVRTRRYGDSPLELLELAEWVDCDPNTPRGKPLHGDIFEKAARQVALSSEAVA